MPDKDTKIVRKTVNCFSCRHRKKNAWSQIEQEEALVLNKVKVCNTYLPGQSIFYQGNSCAGLYCIQDGCVSIRKIDPQGNCALVRLAGPGESLGYRTYFSGGAYMASAVALKESQICFIDRGAVEAIFKKNPALGYHFAKKLAGDLEAAEENLLQKNTKPIRARLCHLLLTLNERFGDMDEDGNWTLELPMTRQDLAVMLGARPETLTRAMNALAADNILISKKRILSFADLDLLLDEAEIDIP